MKPAVGPNQPMKPTAQIVFPSPSRGPVNRFLITTLPLVALKQIYLKIESVFLKWVTSKKFCLAKIVVSIL